MPPQPAPLAANERAAAIEGVARRIERDYVDAEAGTRMAAAIRASAGRGAYDAIVAGEELARMLTRDLQSAGRDLHTVVHFSPEVLPPEPEAPSAPSAEEIVRFRSRLARENYGFKRIEILPGNIGLARLDLFAPPEFAADVYLAAMAFVALIIDLRENGGSMSPDAIPLLCSYFFERPTHLIDITWSGEPTRQLWTLGYVPGRRYLDKPIYLLTSRRTFSGAEELAYDLQNLKRAMIVGEITGGGANPGGIRRASDHFTVFIPFGRVSSPITKTNWEGTGVTPDIAVPAGKALLTAQAEALRALRETADEERREELARAEQAVAAQLARFTRVTFQLEGFEDAGEVGLAGSFNSWSPRSTPLERRAGMWVAEIEAEPGRHRYQFVVDGEWRRDPANSETEGDDSVRAVAG
jgi:retinol-binding protein 3